MDHLDPKARDSLIQLHIAEYNALTSRITNWLTLLNGVWVLMATVVVIIPYIWSLLPEEGHNSVLYLALAAVQIMLCVWAHMMFDQYSTIRYIEVQLRPKVALLVGHEQFWLYEAYMGPCRG